MILPDVNVYVNALHRGSPFHPQAKEWLELALVGSEGVALWDVSLVAAYRLLTNPNLKAAVGKPEAALAAIDRIRAAPAAVFVAPGNRFWEIFSRFTLEENVRGGLASDAMLAALALEHRCRIATFGKDFTRFKGLQTFKPNP